MRSLTFLAILIATAPAIAQPPKATSGNRLAYLDELDPYYPHAKFPKLITPQWIGEDGVEAVVILAIDDMREPKKYETFLRPILRRLQKIDGRAPVSIMTCKVDPKDPQLQTWLAEGLSIECHTIDHPCPFFKQGFEEAKSTYDRCVDLMNDIPGNKPVAFRMPCCDSLNTPSPRFWAEIFNKTTNRSREPSGTGGALGNIPQSAVGGAEGASGPARLAGPTAKGGNFLSIDSSVFMYYTSDDPELPKSLTLDADRKERFKRYVPFDRSFVNTIENYPYPYVIGNLCWQFPCMTPSDWQAQHIQKPNNPKTVEDWKAALDCTVIKQGVMTMVFHPHGWIRNDQMVELIDYAVAKHGKKVKFLTFKEALARLNKSLLNHSTIRHASCGWDNGNRVLDIDDNGYVDAVIGGVGKRNETRLWQPSMNTWLTTKMPESIVIQLRLENNARQLFSCDTHFGFARAENSVFMLGKFRGNTSRKTWQLVKNQWKQTTVATKGLDRLFPQKFFGGFETDVLLVDIDGDGSSELIKQAENMSFLYHLTVNEQQWKKLPFGLPDQVQLPISGNFASARFLDLNADGKLDIIFSNEKEYGIYLFTDMEKGWSKKILHGKRSEPRTSVNGAGAAAAAATSAVAPDELPMISRQGQNNGFWVHSGHLWWSNEDTVLLKDHVDRRKIADLLK